MCIRDRACREHPMRLHTIQYTTRLLYRTPSPKPSCSSTVSYTHLRAHETPEHLVCRLLLEKKKKKIFFFFFFLMIRRPPRSTLDRSSAASDVYKRQVVPNTFAEAILFF